MKAGTIFGRPGAAGAVFACCIAALLAFPAVMDAHRLDEYLQATRLALAADRIGFEIDLTPGVEVAPTIFALIDGNRDGSISEAEGAAYANRFLKEIVFEVDGSPRPVTLLKSEFPSFQDMNEGTGVIRIAATAAWAGAPGRHSVFYQNNHQQKLGVYLVNALLPESRDIEITGQNRDSLQHGIQLDFSVKSADASFKLSSLSLALSLALSTLVWFWRSSTRREMNRGTQG